MIAKLFEGLSDAEIAQFSEGTLDLKPGEVLFKTGDLATSLYVIYKGEVEVFPADLPRGAKGVRLGEGNFLGEVALIEERCHNSTAVAATNASLLELNWKNVEKVMDTKPELVRNLVRVLTHRLRSIDKRLISEIAQRSKDLNQAYDRINAVLNASRTIEDPTDWIAQWKQLLEVALPSVKAERGTIYVYNQQTGYLSSQVIKGDGVTHILLPAGVGMAGNAVKAGKSLMVKDALAVGSSRGQ
jgi:CRP-like cAMP-binding protein